MNGKYYSIDMGLRNRLLSQRQGNLGHIIENIVFLELLRRGYEVTIGKNMSYEVDFIAVKSNQPIYIQVSLSALEKTTYHREIQSLLRINDQYPKYLITMDKVDLSNQGIIHMNLITFLLNENCI